MINRISDIDFPRLAGWFIGNNRITWREHDDTTGMLKAITTQSGLQAWDYEFDGIGNLL